VTTQGVTQLYYGYVVHLGSRKEFIAPLQLTGRLEEFLVHEFIGYSYAASGKELLGLSNLGNRSEQKYDIAFVKGKSPQSKVIVGLVEAKYLGNAHRLDGIDTAKDEVATTLKDLRRQLHRVGEASHAGIPVRLKSRNKEVYGLVFVSYTKPMSEPDGKEAFYTFVKRRAQERGFRFLDYETPQLNSVYEDVNVEVLGKIYSVSLRAGLWRAGLE